MKEKLTELIYACINDDNMYKNTYIKDNYVGINERMKSYKTSYVSNVTIKGRDINFHNSSYRVGMSLEPTHTHLYELAIGFGKAPLLTIYPVRNMTKDSKTIVQSIGTRTVDGLGIFRVSTTFNVTIVTEEREYQIKCGSFAFIIDEAIVRDIHAKINAKRLMIAHSAELAILNERFDKYKVK